MNDQQPYPAKEVRAIIDKALRGTRVRRHPAEVTSDRLGDAAARWHDQFTGTQLDAISEIRDVLERIAENVGEAEAVVRESSGGED